MAVLFLKPVFNFWLWKVFSDSIVTLYFSSLYFFCSFRGKSIYLYSWFISRVQVSDRWQFLVIARALNLWGTLGTRLPTLSLFLHNRSSVHPEGHVSSGPFSESSSLWLLSVFTALIRGKGLLEILQFSSVLLCSMLAYNSLANTSSALSSASLVCWGMGCLFLLFHLQLRVLYIGFHLVNLYTK